MLFFGGYGVQAGRESYMIPVDATIWKEADVRHQGVSIESVLDVMKERGARAKLVVIDASRRNPYERRFRSFSHGLAPIAAPDNALILSSATPGQVADDSSGPVQRADGRAAQQPQRHAPASRPPSTRPASRSPAPPTASRCPRCRPRCSKTSTSPPPKTPAGKHRRPGQRRTHNPCGNRRHRPPTACYRCTTSTILAAAHGTLYIGVTNSLQKRLTEHRCSRGSSFVKTYGVYRLVYVESDERPDEAIAREKQLKRWKRDWKIELIERENLAVARSQRFARLAERTPFNKSSLRTQGPIGAAFAF